MTADNASYVAIVADVDSKPFPLWTVNSTTSVLNSRPELFMSINGQSNAFPQTWQEHMNMHTPTHTGIGTVPWQPIEHDWWPNVPCPDTWPHTPVIQPLVPSGWLSPWMTTIVTTGLPVQPCFRVLQNGDTLQLSLDIPGVKPEEVVCEVENGSIRVSALRADTKVGNVQTHWVGHDYDVKTCEATAENGVLTVTIQKLKEKRVKRIVVKVK